MNKMTSGKSLALNLTLTVLGTMLLLPFVWMVLTSFKSLGEVNAAQWMPPRQRVAAGQLPRGVPADPVCPVLLELDLCRVCGDFFAGAHQRTGGLRIQPITVAGPRLGVLFYLSTMMLPGLVMLVPNYQIMISLGLVGTLAGLILPTAFSAFGTFLLRQFMLTIPLSLDETASIDGASNWRLLWHIVLPLSRPGLVTLTVFTFMGNYNLFFWPLVMPKSEHELALPVGLLAFDASSNSWPATNLMMAAVTMSVIPMIIGFVILQKQLVKGI